MPEFNNSIAVVIGINDYSNGVPPLRTAANDARRLAQLLQDQHGYAVTPVLDGQATRERFEHVFSDELRPGPDDRVLFYFAGHGVAMDGDDGPNGYLLPHDADVKDPTTFIRMPWLSDALNGLTCRHLLVILDSCFGGAFRWSATRDIERAPKVMHKERYDRFVQDPAWQVITSASHDQTALDALASDRFGKRGEKNGHSPFAMALFEALAGKAEAASPDEQSLLETLARDGVITATELYLYLEEVLQTETEAVGARQTPRLWPLKKHDKGEFIFHVPGHQLNLPPAPPLNYENNPYRGLEPYEKEHAPLFFGRGTVIDALRDCVESQPLTVVLGASGTGKSSVVKAGLLPQLEQDVEMKWEVLPVIRPGRNPLATLARAVGVTDAPAADMDATSERIFAAIANRLRASPEKRLLLVIDQFEELVTMTKQDSERIAIFELIAALLDRHPEQIRILVTVRTDFEPQFSGTILNPWWMNGRYVVPALSREDLRAVIEEPASLKVLYFKPGSLVDTLVDEVANTPGGLPLLSFALSEMYIRYVNRQSDDRSLTDEDYRALGGVVGALRSRADEEYEALDEQHRETMRRVMLRMVAVEGGNVARQRVRTSELEYPDDAETSRVMEVVRRLTDARLLVAGQEDDGQSYVEPAHDALVRAWDKLIGWIRDEEGRQANLRFQQSMAQAAHDWDRMLNPVAKTGLLWRDAARGGLLTVLVAHEDDHLDVTALTFWQRLRKEGRSLLYRLRPSMISAPAPIWMNRRELAFARRSVRRRRNIRIGLAFLGILILTGGVSSAIFGVEAIRQTRKAVTERDRAQANALVSSSSLTLLRGEYDTALRLSVQANKTSESTRTRESLLRALQETPQYIFLPRPIPCDSCAAPPRIIPEANGVGGPGWLFELDSTGTTFLNPNLEGDDPQSRERAAKYEQLALQLLDAGLPDSLGRAIGYAPYYTVASVSDDGRFVQVISGRSIILWDARDNRVVREMGLTGGGCGPVAFSPDGALVAVSGYDLSVEDALTGEKYWTNKEQYGCGHAVAFSDDGKSLANVGYYYGNLEERQWDVRRKAPLYRDYPFADSTTLLGLAIRSSGDLIAFVKRPANRGQEQVWLWTLRDEPGASDSTLVLEGDAVRSAVFNPSTTLAAIIDRWQVWEWDIDRAVLTKGPNLADLAEDDEFRDEFESDEYYDNDFSWLSEDGSLLARTRDYSADDIWDLRTGKRLDIPGIESIAQGPDGTLRVFANAGVSIRSAARPDSVLQDVQILENYDGLDGALSQDGTLLAFHEYMTDRTAPQFRMWDVDNQKLVFGPLAEDLGSRVRFTPDKSVLILAGSYEGTVTLWDVASRANFGNRLSVPGFIESVTTDEVGTRLAVSVEDTTGRQFVRQWSLDLPSMMDRACSLVNRNFSQGEWDIYVGDREYECTCAEWGAGVGAVAKADCGGE